MNKPQCNTTAIQAILQSRQMELTHILREPDGLTIQKSADQMDEIQFATERDLAILNVDRESNLLNDVKGALTRIQEGCFGTCIDCDEPISPKRLAAVPWAARCIQCQDLFEKSEWQQPREFSHASLLFAA